MKFLIINGPNLNMLGIREQQIYGTQTYRDLVAFVKKRGKAMGVKTAFFQSNSEGAIVTAVQKARGRYDGIVINAGAYTHTSVAILDALKAVALPCAEVHISDVNAREEFRKISYVGMYASHTVVGMGFEGYAVCMELLKKDIEGVNDDRN